MKTVIITGGSRGLGAEICRCFADNGWRVLAVYKSSMGAMDALVREITAGGGVIEAFCCDVSDNNAVNSLFTDLIKRFRIIDALVNNAGITRQELFTEMSIESWHEIIAVNLNSVFYTCRAVVPAMRAYGKGSIVNVSSVFGIHGGACETHYSAAKGGVIAFTRALGKELEYSGIAVNAVCPGFIPTDMTSGYTEEEIADFCARYNVKNTSAKQAALNIYSLLTSGETGVISEF